MKRALVIAVDGPSGVGKTTVSKLVAKALKLRYIDTGAMYRALALALDDAAINIDDEVKLEAFLATVQIDFIEERVILNAADLSKRIREPHVGSLASKSSSKSAVRRTLVARQREMAEGGAVLMEGRDIGTVVLPSADVKFFLTASHEVRAQRRQGDFSASGKEVNIEDVSSSMLLRDERDKTRADSPLKEAEDAVCIDTGALDIDGVVEAMLVEISKRTACGNINS